MLMNLYLFVSVCFLYRSPDGRTKGENFRARMTLYGRRANDRFPHTISTIAIVLISSFPQCIYDCIDRLRIVKLQSLNPLRLYMNQENRQKQKNHGFRNESRAFPFRPPICIRIDLIVDVKFRMDEPRTVAC